MFACFKAFYASESGATAIEYSLIAAFIGIAIVGVLQTIGIEIRGPFEDVYKGLKKRTV
jgi:pilus assembly protein Flp/PilA